MIFSLLQTSHHISFMLYLLGTNLGVHEKRYQEISSFARGDESITGTDIQHMTYLKAVDKEVQR
jgi:cytochrome P450